MDNIFKQELPKAEISSLNLRMTTDLLFEKLRPLFKNPSTGGISISATDMNNIFHRIAANVGYATLMLELLINEVVIPEKK